MRHPTTHHRDSSYRWSGVRIHAAEGERQSPSPRLREKLRHPTTHRRVFHAASDYSPQRLKLQVENPNTHCRGERRSRVPRGIRLLAAGIQVTGGAESEYTPQRGEAESESTPQRGEAESEATPQREVADSDYTPQSVPPGIRVQPQCPGPCGEACAETKWPARRFRKEQTKHCSIASNAPDTRLRESSSFLHVTLNPTHSTLRVVLLEFWSVFFDRGGFLGCRKRRWGEVEDVT